MPNAGHTSGQPFPSSWCLQVCDLALTSRALHILAGYVLTKPQPGGLLLTPTVPSGGTSPQALPQFLPEVPRVLAPGHWRCWVVGQIPWELGQLLSTQSLILRPRSRALTRGPSPQNQSRVGAALGGSHLDPLTSWLMASCHHLSPGFCGYHMPRNSGNRMNSGG